LVKYWGAAAIPLRHIDANLAIICENKSEFWISPETCPNEEIKALGIKLEDVTKAYRQLAIPGHFKTRR
jgi:hypothetical protein